MGFLEAFQPVVGRASDRQFFADQLDSQEFAMFVDEGDHHFCQRLSLLMRNMLMLGGVSRSLFTVPILALQLVDPLFIA